MDTFNKFILPHESVPSQLKDKGYVNVALRLTENDYNELRKAMISRTDKVNLFKHSDIYNHIKVSTSSIKMYNKTTDIVDNDTDVYDVHNVILKTHNIGLNRSALWINSYYNYKTNEVGSIKKRDRLDMKTAQYSYIPQITQTSDPIRILKHTLGVIGNPPYFMIIEVADKNKGKITKH